MRIRKVSKDAETLEDDLADPADGNAGAEEWANFSYVNGFITAAIVSPKFVDTAEWLSLLLEVPQEELTKPKVTPARELLMIEYRSILDSLAARDGSYSPYFWVDDDEGRLMSQDWAAGFLAGMELRKNAWDRVLEDENLRTALLLVLTLLRDEEFLASIEEGGRPHPGGSPSRRARGASARDAGPIRGVAAWGGAAGSRSARAGEKGGAQRSLSLRLGQEVQEVLPELIAPPQRTEPGRELRSRHNLSV